MTPAERSYCSQLLAARDLAMSARRHALLGETDVANTLTLASRRAIQHAQLSYPEGVARDVIVRGGLGRIDAAELQPIEPLRPRVSRWARLLGLVFGVPQRSW
jgi:1,6-anhydro-N-acetylmuramate kinase